MIKAKELMRRDEQTTVDLHSFSGNYCSVDQDSMPAGFMMDPVLTLRSKKKEQKDVHTKTCTTNQQWH